ncbi:MAG TPA: ribokinase [Streptosporangiaceae bacterium]|nr:ribokinase [Streptosporangiaceae bacterium]
MTRIAVFGSANMDLVAYVAEPPGRGETVTGREFRTVPGGKGANQAIAAARAGAAVRFFGAVGDDDFGPRLRATLADAGADVSRLRTVSGASGIAHIVVADDGGNSIIVVAGANAAATAPEPRDLAGCAALLLQLELPMPAVLAAAGAARAAGVPVVLTPAPVRDLPADLLAGVDLLVPNEHEAARITGVADPEHALAALLERVPEAVITLGERGALYGSRGAEPIRVSAPEVRAVDTTAAGDTFAGALAVARAEGGPPESALRFAAAAAALSVRTAGASTSMPARADIETFLESASS